MLTWQDEPIEVQAARLQFCFNDPLRTLQERNWCLARLHSNEHWRKEQQEIRQRSCTPAKDEERHNFELSLVKEERRRHSTKLPPRGFDLMASSSSNVVGVHYRVGKKIGEGSFGVIFEGTNLLNNNQVAIKFVRCSISKQATRD